jgi:integrase
LRGDVTGTDGKIWSDSFYNHSANQNPSYLLKENKEMLGDNALGGLTFHDLGHTFTSLMIREGSRGCYLRVNCT